MHFLEKYKPLLKKILNYFIIFRFSSFEFDEVSITTPNLVEIIVFNLFIEEESSINCFSRRKSK